MNNTVFVLLRSEPDQPLYDVIRSCGQLDRVELGGRFRNAMGWSEGKPAFHTEDAERLVARLREGPIEAFSEADPDALERLRGQQFCIDNHVFEVTDGGDPARHGSFVRRVVMLNYKGIYPPSALDELPGVIETSESELPAIFIDPIALELMPQQTTKLFKRPEVAATAAIVCPPIALGNRTGYHSTENRGVRELLRQTFGAARASIDRPTAVWEWLALDTNEVRELVAGGAFLKVIADAHGRTSITLNVPRFEEAPAAYRARFYLGEAPEHARPFATALQADIRALVPGGLHIVATDQTADWALPAGRRNYNPGLAAVTGSWQEVEKLIKLLPKCEARTALDRRVLAPAMRDGRPADHALVERLLSGEYLRGDGASVDAVWLQTVVNGLLPYFLNPENRTPDALLAAVLPRERGSIDRDTDGTLVLRYIGSARPEEIRRWQLLLPPGACIEADRTMRLDDSPSAILGNMPVLDRDVKATAVLRDWGDPRPVAPSDFWNLEEQFRWLNGPQPEGLIRFVNGVSLTLEASALVANDLAGTTAAGLVVRLKPGDRVSCALPERFTEAGFDVRVESADGTTPVSRDDDECSHRYRLVVEVAKPGEARPLSRPNQLDLGRFTITDDNRLVRISYSKVQTLDAISPRDAEWSRFIEPVRAAVIRLQRKLDKFAPGNWAHTAYASLAGTTVLGWSGIRLDRLAKQLRFLRRLRQYSPGDDLGEPIAPPNFADVPGDELPTYFASLFDEVESNNDEAERPLVLGRDVIVVDDEYGVSLRFVVPLPKGRLRAQFVPPAAPTGAVMLTGPTVAHRMTPPVSPAYALDSAPFEPVKDETYRITPAIPPRAFWWIASSPQPVVKGTVS